MKKKIYALMNGVELNHDGEVFKFLVTSDADKAKKIQKELEAQMNREDEDEVEYGNDTFWQDVDPNAEYVYVIWLNELSNIYAGNEIMGVFDNEEDAKRGFHELWEHQTERWGFDDCGNDLDYVVTKEPVIDFSKNNSIAIWRADESNYCGQVTGICKVRIDAEEWIEAVSEN